MRLLVAPANALGADVEGLAIAVLGSLLGAHVENALAVVCKVAAHAEDFVVGGGRPVFHQVVDPATDRDNPLAIGKLLAATGAVSHALAP